PTLLREAPWVTGDEGVSQTEARSRFQTTFPSLAELVGVLGDQPLPASFEVAFDATTAQDAAFDQWLADLRALEEVDVVDDDRDWVRQLARAADLLQLVGAVLGAILLAAAMFTIGSVIRLTAF